MSERNLRPIDWKKTDSENFSELMAQGFADRNMEYLPGGLVLKKPVLVEDNIGSSEIQVIGIPFKNVFGKTKFRYNRVKLSDFEYDNKQFMGDKISPIRLKEINDDESVLAETKKVLSKRLSILPQRFILELVEKELNNSGDPRYKYKFYFDIPETDFTDKENGLSIINDKDVFVYVEKTNIKIENGQAILSIDDTTESLGESVSGLVSNDPYSSYSRILPAEYRLINITIGEDFGTKPKNEILFKSPGGRFRGQISEDLKADSVEISVAGNSTYNGEIIEGVFGESESPILKIKTIFGGEYRAYLADQMAPYSGPNAIDVLESLAARGNSSLASSISSISPSQSSRTYNDSLSSVNSPWASTVSNISSKDFKQRKSNISDPLNTLSITSSSVTLSITSGGQ